MAVSKVDQEVEIDDLTLDSLLAKEPIEEQTKEDRLKIIERLRRDRTGWLRKQEKKGKEE